MSLLDDEELLLLTEDVFGGPYPSTYTHWDEEEDEVEVGDIFEVVVFT